MRYHIAYTIVAVITFVLHLVAGLLADIMYWLPECLWFTSIVFSVLAIYSGIVTATQSEPDKKGTAIASAVTGGIVLGALLFSGVYWLFFPLADTYGALASAG